MGVREDLIAAKALIDTPEKWVKNDSGDRVTCWCVVSACSTISGLEVGYDARRHAMLRALEMLVPTQGVGAVAEFNDLPATSHTDIMALFDRAIAKAGASHV